MLRRKVCVVLVDRANYGRLKPVMLEIQRRADLEMQVVASGTMVLERFGHPVDLVRQDGFDVHGEVYLEVEGSTPATMAKSIGFGVVEFSSEFQRLKPHIVLLIGDRYEALAAALAAAYMNICIVHIQGGEVSGSIDESARHAITKLAHFHFPSTKRSADYILRMGEHPDSILGVGCPSSDIARLLDGPLLPPVVNNVGSGAEINMLEPFLLVVFHPTTTDYGDERGQMTELLEALRRLSMQTVLLWPNIDAGSDSISKAVRIFRDKIGPNWLRTLTNLAPENYLRVLSHAVCAIGNSSSFVRDASFFGTPVILVGNRQEGREIDQHVQSVNPVAREIEAATRFQLRHGRYTASTLYGDGRVSARIAAAVAQLTPYVQKRLYYVYEKASTESNYGSSSISGGNGSRGLKRHTAQEHRSAAR